MKDIKSLLLKIACVRNKPMLFYRYADIHCNTCFETKINALQNEFANTPEIASIICSYMMTRDFNAFKRLNKIKLPLYRIDSDAFDSEIENILYHFTS